MSKAAYVVVALAWAMTATSSLAATSSKAKAKPRSAASATLTAEVAEMPAGKLRHLRKTIAIRGADKASWETHALVPIKDHTELADAACQWNGHQPPSLEGAKLFIQTDKSDLGEDRMFYLLLKNDGVIARHWEFGGSSSDSSWLISEVANDWTYFILFEDAAPGHSPGTIQKKYRIEVFPPESQALAKCNDDRPTHAVTLASRDDVLTSHACETGVGDGTEPKH